MFSPQKPVRRSLRMSKLEQRGLLPIDHQIRVFNIMQMKMQKQCNLLCCCICFVWFVFSWYHFWTYENFCRSNIRCTLLGKITKIKEVKRGRKECENQAQKKCENTATKKRCLKSDKHAELQFFAFFCCFTFAFCDLLLKKLFWLLVSMAYAPNSIHL